MRAKVRERAEARALRARGVPYKRIAAELKVSVNSAYRWTRDIELTPEQKAFNQVGPTGPQNLEVIARRAAAWSAQCRARRAASQEEGRAAARLRDDLHLKGCMLYWAEGAKARNAVAFARRFLTERLAIRPASIRLRLNVYTNNGLTIETIEERWLAALDLPRSSLRTHSVDRPPTSSSGKSRKRLLYGVCTLVVPSTRAAQHIYGAIQEYAGIERPEWLDLPI